MSRKDNTHRRNELSRRRLLKGTALGAGALAVPGVAYATTADSGTSKTGTPARTRAGAAALTHPGMLHSADDFARMAEKVRAGAEPWKSGWERLTANPHSAAGWTPRPLETVVRGGDGQNYPQLYKDIHAAYQNALRWKVTGERAHGDTARDILNAWSAKLRTVTGNADRFLASGIYGYQFANAAEIMRGYDGFDLARCQEMLADVFYPLCDDFLKNHNGACITNYWANWDLCNMAAVMAIGILNDDRAKFDQAVDYFHHGEGNGSLAHAVPFLHEGGLAQWQESGRDQGHSLMGIGLMGTVCEMALKQGIDLYGADDNRFMKACEYVAKYNHGESVPFRTYSWGTGQNCAHREQTVISENSRGQTRPVWERVYHHYHYRKGYRTPYLSLMAREQSPEGGGGDHGPNSGGYDELGFGTLTYVLKA
ncbi:alginate lyase family protein [Streptomyces smyrnaeus]|uniref:Alginate lyase family protein n=1 Tax=Streptomyces smyrnaeus TaxID=1387713 RepID=A0ABS3XZV9_9ACTN|nr:alginate lyase family protein [Streptomyces smyrnaeus]MBO8200601.1 alginate lyase family protein [Streptomyces smyrnaeus]